MSHFCAGKFKSFGFFSGRLPYDCTRRSEQEKLQQEGEGEGAIRRVETPGGVFVERCEAHDSEAHRFSYRILESPAPFRDYVAVVKLSPLDGGRCAIEWSCEFGAAPDAAEGLRGVVEDTYRKGFIAALAKSLA